MGWFQHFWRDESGQDLIEYTLLVAFFGLLVASFSGSFTASVQSIAELCEERLHQAATGPGL